MKPVKRFACMVLLLLVFSSCRNNNSKKEIEAALQHYDRLIEKVDGDSIALLYAPDGDLGTMAHGRDSIRKFLSAFKNVQVLSNHSDTKFIALAGDSALQRGTYKQVAVVNNRDTLILTGQYTANWIKIPDEGWRIKKMTTLPDKQ